MMMISRVNSKLKTPFFPRQTRPVGRAKPARGKKRGAFPRDPSPHARVGRPESQPAGESARHPPPRRRRERKQKKKGKEKRPLLAPPLAASPPSRFPLAPRLIPAESDARLLARPHSGAFRQQPLPLLLGGGHKRGAPGGWVPATLASISPLLRVAAEFGRSGACELWRRGWP